MWVLLRPLPSVVAVEMYWATIVLLGWTLITAAQQLTKNKFVDKWTSLPIAGEFVIATAAGFAWFGLFTIIGYALALPVWTLLAFYGLSVIGSLMYLIGFKRALIAQRLRGFAKSAQSVGLFSPLGIMLIILVVDLFMTFFIGGFMGGDGFVHVSKIRHLVNHGFTLTDGYYGTIPETRHTISVMHTLMAVPSALGINPITTWYASGFFLQLVKDTMVFYFAWRVFTWVRGNARTQYAALATILSLALFNNYFIAYPSLFVAVWVMLFWAALFDLVRHRSYGLLIMSSLLIALTHPLAAFAVAILLGILTVWLALFERPIFTRRFFAAIAVSGLVLMSTPLFTATLPNQMTDAVRDFGAKDYAYYLVGGHKAFLPDAKGYLGVNSFSATTKPIMWLSGFAMFALLWLLKDRRQRIVLGATMMFAPLVLYNALSFTVLSKFLPVWGISRFTVVNQFAILLPFIGILVIVVILARLLKSRIANLPTLAILTVVTLGMFFATQHFGAVDPQAAPDASMYAQQTMVYGALTDVQAVLPDDENAIVLAERSWDSFIIPVVAPLHVVAIHDNNSPPAADMVHRSACFNALYSSLDPALLKEAGVGYVLARTTDPIYELAQQQPLLKPIKSSTTRVLYKFDGSNVTAASNPICHYNE